MNIYEIRLNLDSTQVISIDIEDDEEFLDYVTFDCFSKRDEWTDKEWYISDPKNPKGNFYSVDLGTGAFAFDQKVYESSLFTLLEMSGEILPIKVEGRDEKFYVLNVMECVNCLDKKSSKYDYYDDGSKGRILEFKFHINRMSEAPLFKIPETSKTSILTFTGLKDMEDEFIPTFQKLGFKGLIFEELYSSNSNGKY